MPATKGALRVRMYRVGFGDCFLVSVPVGNDHKHVLVDFGVHPKGDLGVLPDVLDDVKKETGGKLAVLVATHEHADHISGFARLGGALGKFDIGEIWMPWAMNPEDPLAQSLRKKRLALMGILKEHLRAAARAGASGPAAQRADDALANLTGNELAMSNLHSRFGGAAKTIRYLKGPDPGKAPAAESDTSGLTGASVRFLGPPTDEAFLKSMDPPQSQRYLKLERKKAVTEGAVCPFEPRWRLAAPEAHKILGVSRADEKALADSWNPDLAALAFTLDSAMNNSSLVFLLTFRGQGLLFPGDAQWGNWKSWIEGEGGASLLANVSFLKVAHHGSMNATPKDALERMTAGSLAAMVSTQTKPWASIPRMPLIARLEETTKHRLVRSDSLGTAEPRGPTLAKAPKGFQLAPLWADWVAG